MGFLFKYLIMFFCSIIVFTIGTHFMDNKKILNQAFGMIMSATSAVFALISMIGIVMIIFIKV